MTPTSSSNPALALAWAWMLLASPVLTGQEPKPPAHPQSERHFASWPEIAALRLESRFFGFQSAVDRNTTDGAPAYDYSPFLMKDRTADLYRLYSGGRWLRRGIPHADGDHILQFVSRTGAAGTWTMPRHRPELWNPAEEGRPDVWCAGNCLEPEVLKVRGTFYMYAQVQGNPNANVDLPGVMEPAGVDRIVLFTSKDGSNWTRTSTQRGVVVNIDQPARTSLHHEEVIYVPWDADRRPFWMYVAAVVSHRHTGYVRIRSADPTTYDWQQRETGVNLAQFGNQVGYARQAPGGPLFVRITFVADDTGRTLPTLQFSRDGIAWTYGDEGPVLLDGSDDDADNCNCYFLALSTLDGIGELEYLGRNTYRALYAATTCSAPVAPQIFHSEIGVGELILQIRPRHIPKAFE